MLKILMSILIFNVATTTGQHVIHRFNESLHSVVNRGDDTFIITTSDSVYQYLASSDSHEKLLHLEEHTQLVTYDEEESRLLTCVKESNQGYCSFHQIDEIAHPVKVDGNFIPPQCETNVVMIAESTIFYPAIHSIIVASNFHNESSVISIVSLDDSFLFGIVDSGYVEDQDVKLVDGFLYGDEAYFLGTSKGKSVLVEKSLAVRQVVFSQRTISCGKFKEARLLHLQNDFVYMIFYTAHQNILCTTKTQTIMKSFYKNQSLALKNLLVTNKKITAVTTVNGLLLMGTADGSLITFNPVSNFQKTINIAEHQVLPEIIALKSMKSLLIPTEKSLLKLPIETCGAYENVNACYESLDPLCGWCLKENNCTTRWACEDQESWLLDTPFRYSKLQEPLVQSLSTRGTNIVEVSLTNLPANEEPLFCMIDQYLVSAEKVFSQGYTCDITQLNFNLDGKHLAPFNVTILTKEQFKIGNIEVEFYDCHIFETCRSCLDTRYSCSWCVNSHSCVDHLQTDCDNFIGTNTTYRIEMPITQCPAIETYLNQELEIWLPAGSNVSVKVAGKSLENLDELGLVCVVEREGENQEVAAAVVHNFVVCDHLMFDYPEHISSIDLKLNVKTRNELLENPNRLRIQVYKCSEISDNSDNCNDLPKKFNCVWCDDSESCNFADHCSTKFNTIQKEKLDDLQKVEISQVHPTFGPLAGGTKVKIVGKNFPKECSVIIGHQSCLIERQSAIEIECRTNTVHAFQTNYIALQLKNESIYFSDFKFNYMENPLVTQVLPINTEIKGIESIISGGIPFEVHGVNLDSLSDPKIFVVFDNMKYFGDCLVANESMMICDTPPVPNPIPDGLISVIEFSFLLDNVTPTHNLTKTPTFLLSNDPEPYYFKFNTSVISIVGKNFPISQSWIVKIKNIDCTIIHLSSEKITCEPAVNIKRKKNAVVELQLGKFFKAKVYHKSNDLPEIIIYALAMSWFCVLIIWGLYVYRPCQIRREEQVEEQGIEMTVI